MDWKRLKIPFLKKRSSEITERGFVERRTSFLDKDHSIQDHHFNFFTTTRFVIVTILILITPLVANLMPFKYGELSEALCVGEHHKMTGSYSMLEYNVIFEGEKETIIYTDPFNEYHFGEKVKLLYLPEEPTTFLFLTPSELYFNFWGAISFGILMIWVVGYIASRD